MVVGDDGEFVGGEAVLTPDEEVAEISASHERLWALERIDEGDGLAIRDAEAPVGRTGFTSLAASVEGRTERRRENRLGVVFGMRGGQAAFDVPPGLVARIEDAGGLQLLPDVAEPGKALRLHVRRVRAADIRTFRPL